MNNLAQRIQAFKQQYLNRLRHWSAMVAPEELDLINEVILEVQISAEAITNDFTPADAQLYREIWVPILDQLQCMLPNIVNHLELIKNDTKGTMAKLGKGQHVLRGYRQANPVQRTFFERES